MEQSLLAADHADVQHRPRLHGVIPLRDLAQQLHFRSLELGDEAHRADIDAEDGEAMLGGNLRGMQDRPVAAEADEHIRGPDLLLDLAEAEVRRDLKAPVHIERQTERDLGARLLQDLAGLPGVFELFVPIGIRRNDDLHGAVTPSVSHAPARRARRRPGSVLVPAAWKDARGIRYCPPGP